MRWRKSATKMLGARCVARHATTARYGASPEVSDESIPVCCLFIIDVEFVRWLCWPAWRRARCVETCIPSGLIVTVTAPV